MYGEICFGKKCLQMKQTIALPQWAWVEKPVHGVEIHWLSGKYKVLGVTARKEGDVDNLLQHERTHHHLIPWKRWNCIPYLPTPPLGQDMTQGQFLSGV